MQKWKNLIGIVSGKERTSFLRSRFIFATETTKLFILFLTHLRSVKPTQINIFASTDIRFNKLPKVRFSLRIK